MLTLIAAMGENRAIGKDNKLLWHLPDDFKHFKRLTLGYSIIMGRKTFDSLPKVLPKRKHIVISRQSNLSLPKEVTLVSSFQDALMLLEGQDAFVIGGGQIYAEAMKYADRIELTCVEASPEANAFFPPINEEEWEMTKEIYHPVDEHHKYSFWFRTYQRKNIFSEQKIIKI